MNYFFKIFQAKKKLVLLFKFLVAADWKWKEPSQCDVLVYDNVGSETIKLLFDSRYKLNVLPIRGESLNVTVLFTSLFWGLRQRKNILSAYIINYIKKAKPKLVITFIDNSPNLYLISNEVAGVKTVFVQNGQRGIAGDVFETLTPDPSYFVDFMFVHGINIGRNYSKFVGGEIIPIGSIKNNMLASPGRFNLTKINGVAFISQWRPKPKNDFFICTNNHQITHEDFYSAELLVLRFLSGWCQDNGYQLAIIGCAKGAVKVDLEHKFYNSILKTNFTFLPSGEMLDSYHQLSKFDLVCFIDSTLGYESLARKEKTAAFPIRGSLLGISGFDFGWPGCYEDTGKFWTNMADRSNFKKIMDYLRDISDQDWCDICLETMQNIMLWNPDNTIIKERLSQILDSEE